MSTENLKKRITDFSTRSKIEDKAEAGSLVEDFLDALDAGIIRSAEKVEGSWKAVDWVKSGILLTFQIGQNSIFPNEPTPFFDKDTLPLRDTKGLDFNIRIVPGGSSVRRGSFLGKKQTKPLQIEPSSVNFSCRKISIESNEPVDRGSDFVINI